MSKAQSTRIVYVAPRKQMWHLRVHVILEGQDDRQQRRLEGTLCDGLNHLLKAHPISLHAWKWHHNRRDSRGFKELVNIRCATDVYSKSQVCKLTKEINAFTLNEISEVMVKPCVMMGSLVGGPTLPAVQLYTATAGEQNLPVHLHRRVSRQLTRCRRQTEHWTSGGRSITNLSLGSCFIWFDQ